MTDPPTRYWVLGAVQPSRVRGGLYAYVGFGAALPDRQSAVRAALALAGHDDYDRARACLDYASWVHPQYRLSTYRTYKDIIDCLPPDRFHAPYVIVFYPLPRPWDDNGRPEFGDFKPVQDVRDPVEVQYGRGINHLVYGSARIRTTTREHLRELGGDVFSLLEAVELFG